MRLNVTLSFWQEAAESEVVSDFIVAVVAGGNHQDSVRDSTALPCVVVSPLRKQ